MHANIIQISEKPIKTDDYKKDYDYFDNFLGHYADRISDCIDRTKKLEEIKDELESVGAASIKGDVLTITSKEKYFEESYASFIQKIEEVRNTSLEQFCSSTFASSMRDLECIISDESEDWIDSEEKGLMTMKAFMRDASPNTPYYIGSILDYHL